MTRVKQSTRISYKREPEKGEKGSFTRQSVWAAGVRYYSGAAGEDTVDYVYFNGYMYECVGTHTSVANSTPYILVNSGDTTHWKLVPSWTGISTKVLLLGSGRSGWIMDEGVIKHTSGKIQLSEDGSIMTSNGNFIVDIDGNVTAKDGTFIGKIQGDSGSIGDFSIHDGELKITDKVKFYGGATATLSNRIYSDGFEIDANKVETGYHTRTTRLVAYSPGDVDGSFVFIRNNAVANSGYAAQKTLALQIEAKAISGNSVVQDAYAIMSTAGQFAGLRPATFVINASTPASTGMPSAQIIMHLNDYAHTYICADSSRTRDLYLPASPDEGEEIDIHAIKAVRILSGADSRPLIYVSGSAVSGNYFTLSNGTSWRFVWTRKYSSFPTGVWVAIQMK